PRRRGGRLMLALLAALQLAGGDSLPQVTLGEALRRAVGLDPGYVAATGTVATAAWNRRAARLLFIVPAITLTTDFSWYSVPTFNFGTLTPTNKAVGARIDARLDVFTGGQKIAGLKRANAELEAAEANELRSRFAVAIATEADYYAVLASRELLRVAQERLRRAREQVTVARARVISGAAVQTDSLQLLLEEARARVALILEQTSLRVARLQLGRRIGLDGPVDAAPLDTLPSQELPISLEDAVTRALARGPDYRVARAVERSARADVMAQWGNYLPRATLGASSGAFDDHFIPQAITRSALTLTITLPLWDNAQREIAFTQARARRDVAEAVRADLERGVRRDVTDAYDTYYTAREAAAVARTAVVVARENFRVQETRYRSGATTILDLVDSQASLAEAEAGLVQARYAARLALAGLEAILGERLYPVEGE
ncbi:MAG: TolC family protein, partial [Gemmatimonadales bacterium]